MYSGEKRKEKYLLSKKPTIKDTKFVAHEDNFDGVGCIKISGRHLAEKIKEFNFPRKHVGIMFL